MVSSTVWRFYFLDRVLIAVTTENKRLQNKIWGIWRTQRRHSRHNRHRRHRLTFASRYRTKSIQNNVNKKPIMVNATPIVVRVHLRFLKCILQLEFSLVSTATCGDKKYLKKLEKLLTHYIWRNGVDFLRWFSNKHKETHNKRCEL